MLARKVFEKYKETQQVESEKNAAYLVDRYIREERMELDTTYAEYLGAVYDLQKNWWKWSE